MNHQYQGLETSRRGTLNRSGVLIAICACALAFFGISGSAQASATASVSLGSNAAGSPTTAKFAVALTRRSGSIKRININLPTSLNINLPAVSGAELCDPEVVRGPNPVAECPASSIFGQGEVRTPLSVFPLTGSVIAYDSGGAAPGLALAATNWSHTVTSLTMLEASVGSSASGSIIKFTGDVAEETPITSLKLNLTGSTAGDYLRVKAADFCFAKDALDTALTNSRDETLYAISSPIDITGCNADGLITSGPATGSLVFGDSATFDYQYTGAGAFTGFRCTLVRVSDEYPVGQSADCGTEASGSTTTYSGLSEGVYMFRVSTLGFAPAVLDMRKFRVN